MAMASPKVLLDVVRPHEESALCPSVLLAAVESAEVVIALLATPIDDHIHIAMTLDRRRCLLKNRLLGLWRWWWLHMHPAPLHGSCS